MATPLTTAFFETLETALAAQGYQVRQYGDWQSFLDDGAVLAAADILVTVGGHPVDDSVLVKAPRLRGLVSTFTGTEGFDIEACTRRLVPVGMGQTPENTESMAESTVLLMLSLLYDLDYSREQFRAGWRPHATFRARMLKGKTVGLIGFGQIGQAVAQRLAGFGVQLLVAAPRLHAELPAGGRHVELAELLAESDVVSIHAPLNAETRGLIGPAELQAMKPDATLLVTSRGNIVDEAALCRHLETHPDFRAAVDTFSREPLPADSPLHQAPNAILTPHMIGNTRECVSSLIPAAIENVRRIFAGQAPLYFRNPEVLEAWRARWDGLVL